MTFETSDLAAVEAIVPVSRETAERLAVYVELLRKWQKSQNLVAPSTLADVWRRHVADSAQTLAALPTARRWIDFGSGAGFPGLVTAILLAETPGAEVHLVESNRGKAAFLRTVARETGAPAIVHAERIEEFNAGFADAVDGVSARALASLSDLIRVAAPHVARGAVAVFHKGQDFAAEVREATLSWDLDLVEKVSRIDPAGRLMVIRRIVPK
ncbi:MAG: 16S rRNA (guanine(527)-N(7))-methyltransferase RsmG [Hyphomicrobiales bacterium]|nr:16S rRNA (guanine(527)-N(7))-methyltransferase RsmG [Hyphomicrobiales bacterium]